MLISPAFRERGPEATAGSSAEEGPGMSDRSLEKGFETTTCSLVHPLSVAQTGPTAELDGVLESF